MHVLPTLIYGKTHSLDNVFTYYGIFSSNMSSPEFRDVQSALAPKLSDYTSKINQNTKLFKRIKTVYEASLKNPLPADQQRVVELIYKRFEMNGAELDDTKKKRYAEINKELSTLYNKFGDNVLHDEENYITYLTKDQLDGLSDGFIKSAAKIAASSPPAPALISRYAEPSSASSFGSNINFKSFSS